MYDGRLTSRYCKAMVYGKAHPGEGIAFVEKQSWIDRDLVIAEMTKAAVGGAELDAALSGSPVADDFLAALRPRTVLDRLNGRLIPLHVRLLDGSVAAIGYWLGHGAPIPVSHFALVGESMRAKMVGALVVASNEVLADLSARAEERLAQDVVAAAAQALDSALLDVSNTGDDQTPAAITSNVSPIVSSGSSLADIDADLKLLLQELVTAGSNLLAGKWVLHPRTAIYLSMLRGTGGALAYPEVTAIGGRLAGLEVLTTGAMPTTGSPAETQIVLVDSDCLVYGDDGATVSLSSQATIQMSDTPVAFPGAPVELVSLYQSEATAIKAVRRINWRMRKNAVSVLTSVDF